MKKLSKIVLSTLVALGLVAGVVGCGGKTEKQATDSADKAETKTEFVFGTNPEFKPIEFQNEKGENVGFDMDLIQAIAEVEGITIKVQSMTFDGVLGSVSSGKIDGAISGITIKPERAEKMDFSEPYFEANQSVAVKKDSTVEIKSDADLKGLVAGVQIGTTGAMLAEDLVGTGNVKTFNNVTEAFLALENGQVDIVMNDIPVTADYITEKGTAKVIYEIPTGEQYGIAVAKGNKELLDKINSGLQKLKDNGKYDEIYAKWFPKN